MPAVAVVHFSGPPPTLGKGEAPCATGQSIETTTHRCAYEIRITSDERRALDAAAARAGVGPCSFARVAVVAALDLQPTLPPPRRRQPTETARALAKFLGEIGKIGGNLNQLARRANSGILVDAKLVEDAIQELRRLREAIVASRHDDGAAP